MGYVFHRNIILEYYLLFAPTPKLLVSSLGPKPCETLAFWPQRQEAAHLLLGGSILRVTMMHELLAEAIFFA